MGKPQTPAERKQEDKDVAVILFCTFVTVTFLFVGLFVSIYVAAAGLIIAILIYKWYFLILPRRKRR
jgi:Flp pilus assembly protein TadB